MKSKTIAFTAPYKAEIIERDYAAPGKGEVLVKLAVSTISSGTERANYVGEVNVSIGPCPEVPVFPRFAGYSSTGTVVAVGEGVSSLKPGDRVCMSWSIHTQYICLTEDRVVKLSDNISFSEGALFHISTFPMAAVRKCRVELGESAIVMGMGVLGMTAVQLLRAAGAAPVIAADPVPEKRALALELGADYAVDPFAPDFVEQVKALTGGGVKAAIEVTGSGKALDQVLDCMARFGRIALLGCTRHSDFSIDYYHKVHGPGITLIGAHTLARPETESHPGWWTTRDDVECAVHLTELGRLNLGRMVAETHSPAECAEVYTRLANEKAFPVVQFDWTDFE